MWHFFISGYYGDGLNAIIVFTACYLPEKTKSDYHYIMDNLFLWVTACDAYRYDL